MDDERLNKLKIAHRQVAAWMLAHLHFTKRASIITRNTIADQTGVSHRTVTRATKEMIRLGMIRRELTRPGGPFAYRIDRPRDNRTRD